MRPASIITFERIYLVATGLGLVNSLMSLDRLNAVVAGDPAFRALGMGHGLVYAMIAMGIAIPLLLWFLIAQKGSVVAKWLLVAFTAIAIINLVPALRQLGPGAGLGMLVNLAVEALRVAALSFLFRADANAWLGTGGKGHNAKN